MVEGDVWQGLAPRIRKVLERCGLTPAELPFIQDDDSNIDHQSLSWCKGVGPKAIAEIRQRWPYVPYGGATPDGIGAALCGPSTSEELAR